MGSVLVVGHFWGAAVWGGGRHYEGEEDWTGSEDGREGEDGAAREGEKLGEANEPN